MTMFSATASAEGAQFNVPPFPATASAEGRQFNGAPSLTTLLKMTCYTGSGRVYAVSHQRFAKQQGHDMQAEELRALQAPLKQRYREQPQTAMITLSARGNLDAGITCSVETGKALVQAGL